MQNVGFTKYEFKDIFTIADLLSMLPKSLRLGSFGFVYELDISWNEMCGYWCTSYGGSVYCQASELIDTLYDLLIQLIKYKQLNPQEL